METMQRHDAERRAFEAERDACIQKCVGRGGFADRIAGVVFVCAGCEAKRRHWQRESRRLCDTAWCILCGGRREEKIAQGEKELDERLSCFEAEKEKFTKRYGGLFRHLMFEGRWPGSLRWMLVNRPSKNTRQL